MLILFLGLLFLGGCAHAFIDSKLESMTARWINAGLSSITYLVIFYFGTFFL